LVTLNENIEETLRSLLRSGESLPAVKRNLSRSEAQAILQAALYPVEAGGKRVRPQLTCLIAEACGAPAAHPAVLRCAAAVELVHTYSLVHDDLPCMDNDDFRRGKPTTHKVFGEANALLVGDALLTHAFHALTTATESGLPPTAALTCIEVLSRTSGLFGMIGGQWKDLALSKQNSGADWNTLCGIHNLKTGALLGAACALGVVSGVSLNTLLPESCRKSETLKPLVATAEELGITTGLAFQIIDDILDVTRSSAELGKTAGKDVDQNKLTAVSLLGIDAAHVEAERLTQEALRLLEQLKLNIEELTSHTPSEESKDAWSRVQTFILQLLLRTS